jgi:hypothetical protein
MKNIRLFSEQIMPRLKDLGPYFNRPGDSQAAE